MFKLSAIFLFLVFAVTLEYELKCPDSGEWRIRAIGFNCSIISQYVCLFRYPERAYHETCDGLDYSSTGSKLIYEPFFNKAYCSYERYQPFPFSTDGSSKCLYQKSFCSEKGQYVFQKGSIISDISCGCDLTRGYEFVNMPKHECYCIPSEEDCSCHKIPCNDLVDQCPNDADEITTKSFSTTLRENRFSDAINIFDHDNNGKNYRFQCLYITLALSAVMIIVVTLFYALYKHLQGYFIDEPSSDIHIDEGQTLELKYTLLINSSTSFLLNNERLQEKGNINGHVKGLTRILRFSKVTVENDGVYCLKVEGHRSRHTTLTVQPIFKHRLKDTTLTEGSELKLRCETVKENCHVQWFKNDVEIKIPPDGMKIEKSTTRIHTLCISKTSAADIGRYSYSIKIGGAESIAKLHVKAMFKRRLKDMTLMEGSELKLECETVEDNYRVQWFKNDVEIKIQPDGMKKENTRIHTLCISKTSSEDIGTYSIKIRGAESIAKLDIKEMPETIKRMSTNLKNAFLKAAAESGITKRQTIKVMIVGSESAGKTCLLRRLMNKEIDDVKSTDGINIERGKCQIDIETGEWHFCSEPQGSHDHTKHFAVCEFWDFAGRRDFYATHQNFLCTNAVYLLVVDITKYFKTERYYEEFDGSEENIDFWLDNIHCYSIDDKKISSQYNEDGLINPPVIIVGTGIDEIKESERDKRIQLFQDHLNEDLNLNDKRKHIRKLHFLSNKFPKDYAQEFQRLRENIFSEAKALGNWGDHLPTRWIVLEKEMYMRKEKHVLKYTDAKELATDCSFPDVAKTTSELESFFKYEHDIGNIVSFNDVNNFIVLDPEWLANVFRCFVSHQYKDELIGMPEWAILTKTGMLKENLINTLLKKLPSLTSKEHKVFILKLMEKFDIIVRPKNDEYKQHIYMPCMIKPMPFKYIFGKNDIENCKKSSWFCLVFNFLPPSYFNHILVSFVKSKQLVCDAKDKKLGIYRNIGIFNLNETGSEILVICLSKNVIAMQVRQLKNEDVCYSYVKKQLISLVDSNKQRHRINVIYEIRFKCQDGSPFGNDGIGYDEAMERIEYRCTDHNEMHSSKDIYRYWLKEEEVEEERKNKGHRKCNYYKHMSVYNCYDCNRVLCKDCSRNHDNEKKYRKHAMQLISDSFILNCKFHLEVGFVSDMLCLPNGEVFVAYCSDREVKTFSGSGEQKHAIQLEDCPRVVSVVDRNTVAVLLRNNHIALVKIPQNHVQYIRIIGTAYSSGIFTYIKSEFYIGYEYGIVVFDMSGSVNRRIKLSFTPYYICYDVDSQHIYCINREHSQLLCIDRDGNDIFTFTDPSMTSLRRLAIDKEGNVLVLCRKDDDNSGYSVIKVDSNGKKSEVVITNIKTSLFDYPRICYEHLNNSVVIGVSDIVYIYKRKA